MTSPPPSSSPILSYHRPPSRLPGKTKLANVYAVVSLVALLPILLALSPGSDATTSPVALILAITFFALTIGASVFAVRFAQLPYKIIAGIPLAVCTFILASEINDYATGRRLEYAIYFWRSVLSG